MIETLLTVWRHRLAPHAPAIASVLLGGLIAAQVTQMGSSVLGLRKKLLLTAVPGSGEPTARSPVDAQGIAAAHLFGELPAGFSAESAIGPEVASDLKLEGTLAGSNHRHGMAIINSEGASHVYRVGETVGGAALDSVYVDHVVVLRGGRLVSLLLPRFVSSMAPAPAPAHTLPELPRRQRDLAALMRVGGSVENDGGKLRGFRVYPGQNRLAFSASGLRGGDLVTAVNGLALAEQPAQAGKDAFSKIAEAGTVTLTVERGGESRDISVDATQEAGDEGRAAADP